MANTHIGEEKQTVDIMVRFYCKHKEGNSSLCPTCQHLLTYSHERLDRCKFGEQKPSCKQCPIHCYKPDMREQMRQVMRYAGPRMILHHPILAIKHVLRECRKRGQNK